MPTSTNRYTVSSVLHQLGPRYSSYMYMQVSAVQISPTEVLVEFHPSGVVQPIKTDLHIKGIFTTKVCSQISMYSVHIHVLILPRTTLLSGVERNLKSMSFHQRDQL